MHMSAGIFLVLGSHCVPSACVKQLYFSWQAQVERRHGRLLATDGAEGGVCCGDRVGKQRKRAWKLLGKDLRGVLVYMVWDLACARTGCFVWKMGTNR